MKLSDQRNVAASFFPFILLLPQVSNAEKGKILQSFFSQEMDYVSVILASSLLTKASQVWCKGNLKIIRWIKERTILCRAEAEVAHLFGSHHFLVSLAYQITHTTVGPDTLRLKLLKREAVEVLQDKICTAVCGLPCSTCVPFVYSRHSKSF